MALTGAGTAWLALFHAAVGRGGPAALPLPLTVVVDSALALPGTLVAGTAAVWLAARATRRLGGRPIAERVVTAGLVAAAAAAAVALGGLAHDGFFGGDPPDGSPLGWALGRDALVVLPVLLVVALGLAPAAATVFPPDAASPGRRPWQSPAAVGLLVALLMAAGLIAGALLSAAA